MKEFLRLQTKFRVFRDTREHEFRIQVETAWAKERYAKVQPESEGGLDEESRLEERDRRERRREPEQEEGVSFARLMVTDFLLNKRVGQAPRLGEEDEAVVEAKKFKALEVFGTYSGE